MVDSAERLFYVKSDASEGKNPFVIQVARQISPKKGVIELIQEGEFTVIRVSDFETTNSF